MDYSGKIFMTERLNVINQRANVGENLRRNWVLANAVGLGGGMAVFAAVSQGVLQSGIPGSPEIGDSVGHLIALLLGGTIFGAAQ